MSKLDPAITGIIMGLILAAAGAAVVSTDTGVPALDSIGWIFGLGGILIIVLVLYGKFKSS